MRDGQEVRDFLNKTLIFGYESISFRFITFFYPFHPDIAGDIFLGDEICYFIIWYIEYWTHYTELSISRFQT